LIPATGNGSLQMARKKINPLLCQVDGFDRFSINIKEFVDVPENFPGKPF
jgi:hypothetical protein